MFIKSAKKNILIAMSIFLGIMFIDEASVAVTLPNVQKTLHMSDVAIQWVMNGMFLPLAVLVLFGGKLSDHIGARKTFTIGMVLFIMAALICTVAPTGTLLILGRVMQGGAGSLLLATYAVLISMVFPVKQRGMALGTCASVASIFLATGPFIGGALAHYLSWRWIFGINLPLGLLCLIFVYRAIGPDGCIPSKKSFDFLGLGLFTIGFTALTYALMQAIMLGWTSHTIILLLIVACILLPLFVFYELRHPYPLANMRLFAKRNFFAGTIILLTTQVIVLSLTYWAIWLQKSLGLSAIVAGIGLLPAGLPILFMARLGGIWLDQYGPRLPIGLGSTIVLVGMVWLMLTAHYQSYWLAFWGFLAYGTGAPLVISPAIAVVLTSVDDNQRGMAAGMQNTMRQLGATLCFAIVGVIITNINYHGLSLIKVQFGFANMSVGKLDYLLTRHHALIQPILPVAQKLYTKAFMHGMMAAVIFAFIAWLFSLLVLKNDK